MHHVVLCYVIMICMISFHFYSIQLTYDSKHDFGNIARSLVCDVTRERRSAQHSHWWHALYRYVVTLKRLNQRNRGWQCIYNREKLPFFCVSNSLTYDRAKSKRRNYGVSKYSPLSLSSFFFHFFLFIFLRNDTLSVERFIDEILMRITKAELTNA